MAVESLLLSIRWLQDSREYSDLKLVCHDETHHVHKAIVCSRSKWFQTACKAEWGKDDQPKKELDLSDEDPVVVGLMVDYFYQMNYDDALPSRRAAEIRNEGTQTGERATTSSSTNHMVTQVESINVSEYDNGTHWGIGQTTVPVNDGYQDDWGRSSSSIMRKKNKKNRWAEPEPEPEPEPMPEISYQEGDNDTNLNTERLPVNALMYALADKYEINHLKSLARAKFQQAANERLSAPAFAHAAQLVFTTTVSSDTGLRNIVVSTLSRHRKLIDYEGIASLIKSGNEIGWALIQMLK